MTFLPEAFSICTGTIIAKMTYDSIDMTFFTHGDFQLDRVINESLVMRHTSLKFDILVVYS